MQLTNQQIAVAHVCILIVRGRPDVNTEVAAVLDADAYMRQEAGIKCIDVAWLGVKLVI
jgi:hypothetical protein